MADVASNLFSWSTTASSNSPSGSTNIGSGLDDNLRTLQSAVREGLAHYNSVAVASAGTVDLGAATGNFLIVSGTTTITSFGTVSAGIWKVVRFSGALTLTHNGTSLILPGAANITTVAGDIGYFVSEGSGNWRCMFFEPSDGRQYTGVLLSPTSTSPAQTAEGSIVWDSDDDLLTVGTGASRKTMVDTNSTQTLTNKTLTSPTITGPTITNPTVTQPTIQTFTSGSGTYTTPANCKSIRVRLVGAGGSGATSGSAGGNTTFSTLTGNGGAGAGAAGGAGGAGGTASGGDINITGGSGQSASQNAAAGVLYAGCLGGSSAFGGAGTPGAPSAAGSDTSCYGAGGSSDGVGSASNQRPAGGAGGYCEKIINAPSATYSYAVGAGGAAGTGGRKGGDGFIVVEEFYI